MNNKPTKQELTPISPEEIEIINEIRKMDFGRIVISIQNNTIVSREVTRVIRNRNNKNHNQGFNSNQNSQNLNQGKNYKNSLKNPADN